MRKVLIKASAVYKKLWGCVIKSTPQALHGTLTIQPREINTHINVHRWFALNSSSVTKPLTDLLCWPDHVLFLDKLKEIPHHVCSIPSSDFIFHYLSLSISTTHSSHFIWITVIKTPAQSCSYQHRGSPGGKFPVRDVLGCGGEGHFLNFNHIEHTHSPHNQQCQFLQNKYPLGIAALRFSCWVGRGVFVLVCQAQR